MPWKLILFILIMTIFVVFSGFNLSNTSGISFGFFSVQNVPVFISIFFSFLLGMLAVTPILIKQRRELKKMKKSIALLNRNDDSNGETEPQ